MGSVQQEEAVCRRSVGVGIGKCCSDCKTTKTPLWRSGPSGPKSLCNACGIRFRKKRSYSRESENPMKKKETSNLTTASAIADTAAENGENRDKIVKENSDIKVKLMPLGKGMVVLQRQQRSSMKRQRIEQMKGQWGEVETAALLLMALSRGTVFT